MPDRKYFRTDRPEAVARDLVAKHGRCWVDGNWQAVKYRLEPSKLGRITRYYLGRGPSIRDLQNWQRFGGLAIETWRPMPYRNNNPRTPGLVLLECPRSVEELEARALHCTDTVVVFSPPCWDLLQKFVEITHPGEDVCRQFHARLPHLHQRITLEQAAIAQALGYDTADTVPVSLEDNRQALRMARAIGMVDELLPAECQPVKLIDRPKHGELQDEWDAVERGAPEAAGWRVVSDDTFPGNRNWKFDLMLMSQARMGYVYLGEPLAFVRMDKTPDFAHAQDAHDDALRRFREVARLVMGWPRYDVSHMPDPIKARRRRRKPDEGSESDNSEAMID